jgi:WD40 repeat protein/serine/threonine protein kinase
MADLDEAVIFNAARKIDLPNEREVYLRQTCGADRATFDRVTALLGLYDAERDFLETPTVQRSTLIDGVPITEAPGTLIGRYRLLELIGEGGFAVVYLAEQTEPVRRQVALKIIKLGMDTRQVIARFEAERQALAMMDHPGIAEVYDAGSTETGRPYFVMQLIRGIPITEYCDRNRLNTEARLKLFLDVCQAVQHAHQKGIIHRDIKPTNVLVALHDGRPVPKVIDFGIAKATHQRLTEKTLYTSYRQIIGTPQYMSPEQAEFSDLDIDTRSDIYSLGVLLYELLTSTTPFQVDELHRMGYDEICRTIRDSEPPTPSRRLSTLGDAATAAAQNREIDPAGLRKLLRGDLDWIVMKALEKDRNHRYETASAFAADVAHYLANEPVQACPPSAMYRFRKFARRNKAAVLAAIVIGSALLLTIAGLSASTFLIAREQERQRRNSYFQGITLAHSALSADDLGGARKLLDECPEHLRGWEWNYLRRLWAADPVNPIVAGDLIRSIAFSPDDRYLAAAREDGKIDIHELVSGDRFFLPGHEKCVFSVAFHPQAEHLASAGTDRKVILWNLRTRQPVFKKSGHEGKYIGLANAVAFSPDGKSFAAPSDETTVTIWGVPDGRFIRDFKGPTGLVGSVAFSPDGKLLAAGSFDNKVYVWDIPKKDAKPRILDGHMRPVSAVAFSPSDGRYLASASYDRLVKFWDVTTGERVSTLIGHVGLVVGLAFTPDGKRLATVGHEDEVVKLWDPLPGREILSLEGHTNFCHCIAISSDGWRFASSGTDGTIRLWDAEPLVGDEYRWKWEGHHDHEVWCVAFHPDGRQVASAGWDKTVKLWDVNDSAKPHTFKLSSVAFCVRFSPPDGKYLAATASTSLGGDTRLYLWDTATGAQAFPPIEHNGNPYCLEFSPDGLFVLKPAQDKDNRHFVEVWNTRTGQIVGQFANHLQDIWAIKFSPDGQTVATASNDRTIALWRWKPMNLDDAKSIWTRELNAVGFADKMAFIRDGDWLLTVGEENCVTVWNSADGKMLHELPGHTGHVLAVASSPDGKLFASGGVDTTIKVWDATQDPPIERYKLRGHTSVVSSLAFSPDSRRLVSGSRDNSVKVWDVKPLNEMHDAQK